MSERALAAGSTSVATMRDLGRALLSRPDHRRWGVRRGGGPPALSIRVGTAEEVFKVATQTVFDR
jgi:hypothetical protein